MTPGDNRYPIASLQEGVDLLAQTRVETRRHVLDDDENMSARTGRSDLAVTPDLNYHVRPQDLAELPRKAAPGRSLGGRIQRVAGRDQDSGVRDGQDRRYVTE